MALKDSIKHFRDVDNYGTSVEKKDIDDNFDLLADNIDYTPYTADRIKIYQKSKGLGFVFGADTFDITEIGTAETKVFFNKSKVAFRAGVVEDDSWNDSNLGEVSFVFGSNCKALGEYSIAFGANNVTNNTCGIAFGDSNVINANYGSTFGNSCVVNGEYSIAFGNSCIVEGEKSAVIGFGTKTKQNNSNGIGLGNPGDSDFTSLNSICVMETTDDTQTDLFNNISLFIKNLVFIKIKGLALSDDYSTKWVFERSFIAITDEDGNVTISNDSNTDIVKDDSDWAFDIEGVNDSTNPYVKFKVTGLADTNIIWSANCELNSIRWDN